MTFHMFNRKVAVGAPDGRLGAPGPLELTRTLRSSRNSMLLDISSGALCG
jgi:hypothetical protein